MYISWNHNSSEDPVMAYQSNLIQTKIHYRIAEWKGTKMANRIIEEPKKRRYIGNGICCMHVSDSGPCDKRASFNYEGEKSRLYCGAHRKPGMINITARRCEEERCTIIASFNYTNELRVKYCKEHSKPGMVNMIARPMCTHGRGPNIRYLDDDRLIPVIQPCTNSASFGSRKRGRRKYCSIHRLPHMVTVYSDVCDDCDSEAIYGYATAKRPIACRRHRLPEMINVENRRRKIRRRDSRGEPSGVSAIDPPSPRSTVNK